MKLFPKLFFAALVVLFSGYNAGAQNWITTSTTGTTITNAPPRFNVLGTSAASSVGKKDVRFFSNGSERMRLMGQGTNLGFLGIGTIAPSFRLHVMDNVNVDPASANPFDGYRILGQRFLFMPGGVGLENTFVGISGNLGGSYGQQNTWVGFSAGGAAGTLACGPSPHHSTLVGAYAGYQVGGGYIVCVGYRAGYTIGDGDFSTFVGDYAGENTTCTYNNAFFGGFAGQNVTSGNRNTYLGTSSAVNATTGSDNISIGIFSANGLSSGSSNIAIGAGTGANLSTGSSNILIGNSANISTVPITNGTAIGNNAIVTKPDKIILGDNNIYVGIGLSNDIGSGGPQNKLEIDAGINGLNPTVSGNTGASGLRFRDLHSGTLTTTNPGTGYLSVDALGDVIYVGSSASGTTFGNACGGSPNTLTGAWEVDMGTTNVMFNETNAGDISEVGIGHVTGTCANTTGKLELICTNTHTVGGAFINTANLVTTTIGVGGIAASTTDDAIGVKGTAQGAAGAGFNRAVGVAGQSMVLSGSAYNIGVEGRAENGGPVSAGGAFEVLNASTAGMSVGTAGIVGNTAISALSLLPTGVTIGVYGYNSYPTTPVGTNWGGYFDGNLNVNGFSYTTLGVWSGSDKRFKKEIKPLENVLEKIQKVNGYTYNFRQDEFRAKNFDDASHIGFIAQELKEVFPEMVKEDVNGYYAVNYESMVAVLLEAIKAQQKQIDELKVLILQQSSFDIAAPGNTSLTTTLSDKNVVVLNQNVPNPFAESTLITFIIPETSGQAQIQFYTLEGKLINTTDIRTKGKGSLTVFANDLSSGMYLYKLIVDGKIIDTKKMEKQN